jgi:selenocysteine lyase/cysteine desulfurase
VKVYGITDPARAVERCPTVAFTLDGHTPAEIARALGERGIYVRNGNHYAYELHLALGLDEGGGTVRASLGHYNTPAEIERLGDALELLTAA